MLSTPYCVPFYILEVSGRLSPVIFLISLWHLVQPWYFHDFFTRMFIRIHMWFPLWHSLIVIIICFRNTDSLSFTRLYESTQSFCQIITLWHKILIKINTLILFLTNNIGKFARLCLFVFINFLKWFCFFQGHLIRITIILLSILSIKII